MTADSTRDTGPSDRGFDLADRVERDAQADRDWERVADEAIRHTPAPDAAPSADREQERE